MLEGGGGLIFKTKYFHMSAEGAKPCMLGGPGACFPENVLKHCTIWCILGPIFCCFCFFVVFLNVAFADKSIKQGNRRTLNVI